MARTAHTTRTSRRLAAALAVAGATAIAAGPAAAIPTGGGGIPVNEPPLAVLAGTPNPVVIPAPLVLQPVPGRALSNALPDVGINFGSASVSFSAAGSADSDGSIAKYEWDLDGQPGFERTTTADHVVQRYSTTGAIPARVRVTDNRGATDVASLTITAHRAPVARFTGPTVAVVGDGLTFTSASTDDNGISAQAWDMDGDGVFERSGPQQSTSFGTTGPHKVSLRVTDTLGAVTTTTQTVRVHRAPTALIVTQPAVPVVNQPTTLDGSRSSDDGAIAKYEWDLNGDGTFETSTGAVPRATTTFTATGPATVGLRVTDNDGATDQTRLTFTVAATPVATADALAPKTRLIGTALRMSKAHRVSVKVACPAGEQICAVRVQVKGVKGALKGKTLGAGRVQVQGGGARSVSILLTKKAQRAVALRPLKARAILSATDLSGNRAVTRTGVTIRK